MSMDERDALLAKVIMDIHRTKSHSEFNTVPLFALFQVHPINREGSLKTTNERAEIIKRHKEELLGVKIFTREILGKFLPSVSWIKVVQEKEGTYIAFEGNGRLVAMQNVFSPEDDIQVEVEHYVFKDSQQIVEELNRVRAAHNLL